MSEHATALFGALLKVQGALEAVTKNAINPHLKNRYADLPQVWEAVRPALQQYGLLVTNEVRTFTQEQGEVPVLRTTIVHAESGAGIFSELPLTPSQDGKSLTPQQMGSAITYARRYNLLALLALPTDDDDGNTASGRGGGAKNPGTIQGPKVAGNQQAGPKITKEDLDQIRDLAKKGGWKADNYCARYKVKKLEDLTPEQGGEVINALMRGLEQKATQEEGKHG